MKSKVIAISVVAVLVWCGVWATAHSAGIENSQGIDGLVLEGSINQAAYVLGEPVRARFQFVNESGSAVSVPSRGVEVGSLKILISEKVDGEYKEYVGAGWGTLRGRPVELKPGSTHAYSEVSILWNGKPNLPNFSEEELKQALRGRLATEYAFDKPGIYWLKGLSFAGKSLDPIESRAIPIEIKEPMGEDAAVWRRIKGNREIAYLIQQAAFDTDVGSKKQALIEDVEQIIVEHPGSVYSKYLQPNLDKFKAAELRRNEAMRKAVVRDN